MHTPKEQAAAQLRIFARKWALFEGTLAVRRIQSAIVSTAGQELDLDLAVQHAGAALAWARLVLDAEAVITPPTITIDIGGRRLAACLLESLEADEREDADLRRRKEDGILFVRRGYPVESVARAVEIDEAVLRPFWRSAEEAELDESED